MDLLRAQPQTINTALISIIITTINTMNPIIMIIIMFSEKCSAVLRLYQKHCAARNSVHLRFNRNLVILSSIRLAQFKTALGPFSNSFLKKITRPSWIGWGQSQTPSVHEHPYMTFVTFWSPFINLFIYQINCVIFIFILKDNFCWHQHHFQLTQKTH